MSGGPFPPALLCAALGLALAFAPRAVLGWSLATLVGAAVLGHLIGVGRAWPGAVALAGWASVAIIAAAMHLPRGIGGRLAIALALEAGLLAGAMAGPWSDLTLALPWGLISLPATVVVARGYPIVVKVAGSWLIAVALIAAGLPLAPTLPYVPDHME